jgi:hypothetical protein
MKVLERTRAMVTCGKWSRDGQMNEWMDVDQMTRTAQRETDTPRPYIHDAKRTLGQGQRARCETTHVRL